MLKTMKRGAGRRLLIASCCVALFALSYGVAQAAEDKVLISELPAGVAKAEVLAVVKQSFVGRRWTVIASTDDSVTGKLVHHNFDAELRIAIVDGSLRYTEKTTEEMTDHSRGRRAIEVTMPARWIANLRLDISRRLVALPRTTTLTKAEEAAQRIRALKDLFDKGLITQAEFDQKRADAMKDL
jgi:hypothetical protein